MDFRDTFTGTLVTETVMVADLNDGASTNLYLERVSQ
jgi:hypothetical protein